MGNLNDNFQSFVYTLSVKVNDNCKLGFVNTSFNKCSSLMAAITCLVGLHYGHILVHCKVICVFSSSLVMWMEARSHHILVSNFFLAGSQAENSYLVCISSPSSDVGLSFKCHRYLISAFSLPVMYFIFLEIGYYILFVFPGVPLSKPLYTLSYMFVTAGASGVLLTIIYFIVSSCHE